MRTISNPDIDILCDRCRKSRVRVRLPKAATEAWLRHGLNEALKELGWSPEHGRDLEDICPDCLAKEKQGKP